MAPQPFGSNTHSIEIMELTTYDVRSKSCPISVLLVAYSCELKINALNMKYDKLKSLLY